MARHSTKKPASIGRGHSLPTVNPTFEELAKLTYTQLRKYAKNQGVDRPKLGKKALLKHVCVQIKIHHPDDGIPGLIPTPSPSPTPVSVGRLVAADGSTSIRQPPIVEVAASTENVVPRYPAGRVNRLDTRRISPPLEREEDIVEDYLDPDGFNRPAPDSTPEPAERLAPAPPADAESLEQTVQMLQAFRKRNDNLVKQIKDIENTSLALKKTAANLMQWVVIQRTARVRMERYLLHYRQEQPIFAHKVVFPPNDPVFVSVDSEHQTITDELDAMDEDREPEFARFKAKHMSQRSQRGNTLDPEAYDDDEDTDEIRDRLIDTHGTFYIDETSQGMGESEKEMFANSRMMRNNPEIRRQFYAENPDLKPKSLKRTASALDSSNTKRDDSSTDDVSSLGRFGPKSSRAIASSSNNLQTNLDHLMPLKQNKRPRLDSSQTKPSTDDRFALHGNHLWEGIQYTVEGPQSQTQPPDPSNPPTAEDRPQQQASNEFHQTTILRESSSSVLHMDQAEFESSMLPPTLPVARSIHSTHYSPARNQRLRARPPVPKQPVSPRSSYHASGEKNAEGCLLQMNNNNPRPLTRQTTIYGKTDLAFEEELAQQPKPQPEGGRARPSTRELAPSPLTLMPPQDSESGRLQREASYSILSVRSPQRGRSQQNGVSPSASRPRRGLRSQESQYPGKPQ